MSAPEPAAARGRWLESLLAVTAALVATWPVGGLVAEQPWVQPLVGTLLLLVVVGCLVRTAPVPRWVVVLAQLLALLSALSWWAAQHAAPGDSALATLRTLLHEGGATIQQNPVPAPATPGLVLIVLAGSALLGLLVDVVAVTLRAAAVAGIPLLLMTALTASNTGDPLDPRYFLAVAGAWLLLLAREGHNRLEEWRSAGAHATATVDARAATRGGQRRAGALARVMGVAALVLAVLVPGLLPHLPTTTLLDGLSRSDDDRTGSVTFTETLDLAQDLTDRSNAPVIRYRTDEASPPPLRVAVSSEYSGGRWLPAEHEYATEVTTDEIMTINSLLAEHSEELETTTATITVTQNGLAAPQLGLPHPTTAVDLGQVGWRWDPYADVAIVDAQPQTYEATFLRLDPLSTLPESVGEPPVRMLDVAEVAEEERVADGATWRYAADGRLLEIVEADGRTMQQMTDGSMIVTEPDGTSYRELWEGGAELLEVDDASGDWVRSLSAEIVGDRTNQIDIATAIQDYLRSSAFSYSLTLADPVAGPDGEPLDPVSHFLETRQGYCTQFATAMVMMARAQEIPARLAVGFLPGESALDGTRTVVASDAHAWPELFINGLGWTRFEPTPAGRAGLAPYYETPDQATPVPTAAPDPTVADPAVDPEVPDSAAEQGRREAPGWFERHGDVLGQVALGLAVAALVLSTVPLAAWWRREAWRHARGLDDTARIEGEWAVLTTTLDDLDVPAPPGATPRALHDHYVRELEPDAATLDALTRATDRLEAARYAAGTTAVGTMRQDVRRVLDWRRQSLPRRQRLAAWLLPSSGRTQLRSLVPAPPAQAPGT